jgi:hypothetical protein
MEDQTSLLGVTVRPYVRNVPDREGPFVEQARVEKWPAFLRSDLPRN